MVKGAFLTLTLTCDVLTSLLKMLLFLSRLLGTGKAARGQTGPSVTPRRALHYSFLSSHRSPVLAIPHPSPLFGKMPKS